MRIAVVSDEISDDWEEAVQLGPQLGVSAFELRWLRLPGTFQRRRACELSDDEASYLAQVTARGRATVSAVSPGLFRQAGTGPAELAGEMARLEHSFHLAGLLGTRDIVIHGFRPAEGPRNGVCPPGVIGALGEAARRAEAAGMRLLLRNSSDGYADTAAHTASIVHAVHSEALGISWDPCHAARLGEDPAQGYRWALPFLRDVRIRDQDCSQALGFEYKVLGQGCVDWATHLAALAADGYQGTITVGAQIEPRLINTMHSLEALKKLLRTDS